MQEIKIEQEQTIEKIESQIFDILKNIYKYGFRRKFKKN